MLLYIGEDDLALAAGMKFTLEREEYQVETFGTCGALREAMGRRKPDLLLLDWNLPDGDGLELCRRIKEQEDIPALMITARDLEIDQVMCLEGGADDYIAKPFSLSVLKARIRAMLRRASGGAQGKPDKCITVGDLTLDTEQRVAIRDGETVELTAKEYDLIELLMKNPRRVYSRENLMNVVWGYSYTGDYRTVDVHIRRLREKIEADPSHPRYLLTVRGLGYRLARKIVKFN